MSYESDEIKLTKAEVEQRLTESFGCEFPWDMVKIYGITPYSVSQDKELYFALVNRRYTPALELSSINSDTYFSGGITPKVSIQVNHTKDGFKIDVQYVAPALKEDSTIFINKITKLRPIEEINNVTEIHEEMERQRANLITHGWCEGVIAVKKAVFNKETKKMDTKVEDMVVAINPTSNQCVTMKPSIIEAFMFKRKGEMTSSFNGAAVTEEQKKALCSGHEVYIQDMFNSRTAESYDGYVRFDVFNKRAVVSETPTPGSALYEKMTAKANEAKKQENAQKASTKKATTQRV